MPAHLPPASFRPAPGPIPNCKTILFPTLLAGSLPFLLAACDPGSAAGSSPAIPPSESVQVILCNVILDTNCRLLAQTEDMASWPQGAEMTPNRWDGRLSDGRTAGTGEYYVNTEARWPDGRKDTTYQKTALINFGCGG